jgi:ribulose 1,5-bisphosphate synthetase/thiazole synthase
MSPSVLAFLLVISVTHSVVAAVPAAAAPGQARSYDVVVVGAGTGGIAAAIQAARMGATVAVIEETDWIGGQMSASGVGNMDEGTMALRRSGLYHELVSRIRSHYQAQGKSVGTCYFGDQSICVEPSVAQWVFKRMIAETKSQPLPNGQMPVLDVYLRKRVTSVLKTANTVDGLVTHTGLTFASKVIIDATEHGDLLPLSGARYRAGNSTSDHIDSAACVQDITYTAVVRKYPNGVPGELIVPAEPPGYAQARPYFAAAVAREGSPWWQSAGVIAYPVNWVFHNAYRGFPDSASPLSYTADRANAPNITVTGINWANDYPFDDRLRLTYLEDPASRKQIDCEAKLSTLRFLYYMQNDLQETSWAIANDQGYHTPHNVEENDCPSIPAAFKPIERHFPLRPYVREGRRVIGLYTVVAADIKRAGPPARSFPSAVAMLDGPVDLHGCRTDDTLETPLETNQDVLSPGVGPFHVPFESFIPETVDGLLVAEKNLSVSRLVSGAIRFQPSTLLTGQAAGAIAASAVRQDVPPRRVAPIRVQSALLDARVRLSLSTFADVSPDDAFWKYTQLASLHGLVMGYGDGNFGVDHLVTRSQLAVMFVRRFQLPLGDVPVTPTFDDVPATDPAYRFVEALVRAGITDGCATAPRRFCPAASVNRAEFAVMMVRAMRLDVTTAPASPLFTDVPPSHWAFAHVQLFASIGITHGCAATVFCPADRVSRGQAAVFLVRDLMIR